MGPIISLALMLVLFWVLLVMPQRRRMQAQRSLMASLEVGDDVITTAGLYATIVAIDGDEIELKIADSVIVRSARWAIGQRLREPEPELDEQDHDADFLHGDATDVSDAADVGEPHDVDDR